MKFSTSVVVTNERGIQIVNDITPKARAMPNSMANLLIVRSGVRLAAKTRAVAAYPRTMATTGKKVSMTSNVIGLRLELVLTKKKETTSSADTNIMAMRPGTRTRDQRMESLWKKSSSFKTMRFRSTKTRAMSRAATKVSPPMEDMMKS